MVNAYQVCAIIATTAFVGLVVYLITLIVQLRKTAKSVENLLTDVRQIANEANAIVKDLRQFSDSATGFSKFIGKILSPVTFGKGIFDFITKLKKGGKDNE